MSSQDILDFAEWNLVPQLRNLCAAISHGESSTHEARREARVQLCDFASFHTHRALDTLNGDSDMFGSAIAFFYFELGGVILFDSVRGFSNEGENDAQHLQRLILYYVLDPCSRQIAESLVTSGTSSFSHSRTGLLFGRGSRPTKTASK